MTKIDRYILTLFARTNLICFLSLAGVFVVFHAFNNLDELARRGQQSGSMVFAMFVFYGPYLLMLFDWTATIIALMSLLFTVGWLRRSGELTALLAAGIQHGRVLRPMLVFCALVIGVQWFNREQILPNYREQLTGKPSELRTGRVRPMLPAYDKAHGILIEGDGIDAKEDRVLQASFRLYVSYPGFGDVISGDSARWIDATADRTSGYIVSAVRRPEAIDSIASAQLAESPILITRRDAAWLEPGECFVATTLDLEVLRDNPRSTRLAGMGELIRRLRNGSVHSSDALHVLLHERLIRPPLDFCLVLLGLPLVVNRGDRRLFSVIAQAVGLTLLFFGLKTLAGGMGSSGYLLSPAMAAWVPLLVLGPIAFVRYCDVQVQ